MWCFYVIHECVFPLLSHPTFSLSICCLTKEAGKCFHSDLEDERNFFSLCFSSAVCFFMSKCTAIAQEFENGNSIKLFPELIFSSFKISYPDEIAC